ncbi:MAG: ABC transporter ATP-binding protein [Leptospirales bacterium]|nr:ABC transporter ATP-binding protein [Leptospirales bacterium]
MSALAVKAHLLRKTFGDFVAVDSISFEVQRGAIFGFLGANGAGKSTTIRMLCGILPPTSGEAELEGLRVGRDMHQIKSIIGYMSQKFSLYSDLSVVENIRFYGGVYRLGGRELRRREEQILEMADLREQSRRPVRELSGGWKQRLALGCAILHRPRAIFLDEPTAGVDPQARRTFWDIIFRLRDEGATVFVTSHYMDEVEQCDRIALLHRGRIAALGSPSELKDNSIIGATLSIQSQNPLRARQALQGFPELLRIDPFGRDLHAIARTRQAAETARLCRRIQAAAEAAGAGRTVAQPIRPSLEDVFVYIIGENQTIGEAAS